MSSSLDNPAPPGHQEGGIESVFSPFVNAGKNGRYKKRFRFGEKVLKSELFMFSATGQRVRFLRCDNEC
jgi:hypothetical protein